MPLLPDVKPRQVEGDQRGVVGLAEAKVRSANLQEEIFGLAVSLDGCEGSCLSPLSIELESRILCGGS